MNGKDLPNLGTPEECIAKMKEGFNCFVQSAALFITVADYYSDRTNEGKPLKPNFAACHNLNVLKLVKSNANDICEMISVFAAFTLDFISEIRENLDSYFEIIQNGQDEDLDDYDKCCDSLAVLDEFTDIKSNIDEASNMIIKDKILENNLNDPEYDPNAIQSI